MNRLENHLIGVDQGDVILFSDFDSGGPMWSGHGPRLVRSEVTFETPYKALPSVQCWLSMLDMSNSANTRMDVQAENISLTGFEIVFRTWGDTKVARVRVAWMAIGALRYEDDWELDL